MVMVTVKHCGFSMMVIVGLVILSKDLDIVWL